MSRVAACPRPRNAMALRGFIQTLPKLVVGFALEQLVHGLNDVLRIGNDFGLTGLIDGFESETGGDDFGLLIGGVAEIFAYDFLIAVVFENGGGSGARVVGAVAQTAAVTNDMHLFHKLYGNLSGCQALGKLRIAYRVLLIAYCLSNDALPYSLR